MNESKNEMNESKNENSNIQEQSLFELIKPTPLFVLSSGLFFYFLVLAPPVKRTDFSFLAIDNEYVALFFLFILIANRFCIHFLKINYKQLSIIEVILFFLGVLALFT